MEPVIEQNMDKLTGLCQRHHVRRLDVFGSASEGNFSSLSDIDFVVEFDDSIATNRFDNYFHLLEELRKLFGRDIDLVEPGGLKNPYFIERVQQTRRPVYVAS